MRGFVPAVAAAVVVALAMLPTAAPAGVFMAPNGADSAVCGSQASPCATLAHAVARATATATQQVTVQPGMYKGQCSATGVQVTANTFTVQGTSSADQTVFDCGGAGRLLYFNPSNSSNADFALRNMSITGGSIGSKASCPSQQGQDSFSVPDLSCLGGAVLTTCATCSVVVQGMSFDNCSAVGGGGAIASVFQATTATTPFVNIDACLFDSTSSMHGPGGGVLVLVEHESSSFAVTMSENSFHATSSGGAGGGLAIMHREATAGGFLVLQDMTFTSCQSNHLGGAIGIIFLGLMQDVNFNSARLIFTDNQAATGGALAMNQRAGAEGCQHVVSDCHFVANNASETGGAVLFLFEAAPTSSSVSISNSTFHSNIGHDGAAVALIGLGLYDTDLPYTNPERFHWTVSNCMMEHNLAQLYGGALLVLTDFGVSDYSHTTTDCYFNDNGADANGGAVAFLSKNVTRGALSLTNCVFENNGAFGDGGAVYVGPAPLLNFVDTFQWEETSWQLDNCNFTNNAAKLNGGAIFFEASYFKFDRISGFGISRSNFESNTANQGGGAIAVRNVPPTGDQCVVEGKNEQDLCLASVRMARVSIDGNNATESGGGYYSYGQVDTEFDTVTFDRNSAKAASAIFMASLGELSGADASSARIARATLKNVMMTALEVTTSTPSLVTFSTLANITVVDNENSIYCPGARLEDQGVNRISDADALLLLNRTDRQTLFSLRTSHSASVQSWQVYCPACAEDQYTLCPGNTTDPGRLSQGSPCLICPEHASCPGGGHVLSDEGFWTCVRTECNCSTDHCTASMIACPEGFCEENNQCSANRDQESTNVLCGKCLPGYSPVGSDCKKCTEKSEWLWIPLLFISWLWVLYLLYLCQTTLTAKKKIFMYFVQTVRIVLGPLSTWSAWTAAFSMSIAKYICLGRRSTLDLIVLNLCTPLLYLVLFMATWAGHRLWKKRPHVSDLHLAERFHLHVPMVRWPKWNDVRNVFSRKKSQADDYALTENLVSPEALEGVEPEPESVVVADDQHSAEITPADPTVPSDFDQEVQKHQRLHMFVRGVHFLMLFSYETLSEQAMQLLNCPTVCHHGPRLAEYPDIPCDSNEYQPLRIVALLILGYTILFPIGLLVFMIHHRYQLFTPHYLGKFGVFFDHYTHTCFWWQVQELVRRIVILAIYVVWYTDIATRTYGIFVACLVSLIWHLYALPFHSHADNLLESISLVALTYGAGTIMAYHDPVASQPTIKALTGILIAVLVVLAFSAVSELGWYHLWRVRREVWLRMKAYKRQLQR